MEKIKIMNKNALKLFSQIENPYVAIAEAIKNSWDADATKVRIEIDTLKKEVIIKDNALEGVKQPLSVANSEKKVLNKTKLERNVVGNKGIGIWSLYSLGDKIVIVSKYKSKIEKMIYEEENYYKEENENLKEELKEWTTKIKIEKMNVFTIEFLKKEEFQNFLNMFVFNFENINLNFEIQLYIDGEKKELLGEKIQTKKELALSKNLERNSIFSVFFKYKEGELSINIKTKEDSCYIGSNTKLNLDLNSLNLDMVNKKIKKFIEENYNFKEGPKLIKRWFVKDENSNIGIPNFYGKLFVIKGKKSKEMKEYLNGTYIYIENFNLYNFSYNRDWVGWTETTQNWKVNDLKLQNVYAYIKFENYDEKNLKISQQRSGFITDSYYDKFMVIFSEILKTILVSSNHGSNKKRHIENVNNHLNEDNSNNFQELVEKEDVIESKKIVTEENKNENLLLNFTDFGKKEENKIINNIMDNKIIEVEDKDEINNKNERAKKTNISKNDLKDITKGVILNLNNERKKVLDWIFKEIEFLAKRIVKNEREKLSISFSLLARTFLENIIIYAAIEENKKVNVEKRQNYKSLSELIKEETLIGIFGKNTDKFKEITKIIYKRQKIDGHYVQKDIIETINSYPHNPVYNKAHYVNIEPLLFELKDFLEKYYNIR